CSIRGVGSVYSSPALFTSMSFSFADTATTEMYTLSLHDALPIWATGGRGVRHRHALDAPGGCLHPGAGDQPPRPRGAAAGRPDRSEEHTSELQSPYDLVCRLLLEKKKQITFSCMASTIALQNTL